MTEPARKITLSDLDAGNLGALSDDDFRSAMIELVRIQAEDRKQNQLVYYQPASDDCRKVHECNTTFMLVCGGNGACLPLFAPIMMADGKWRALEDIRPDDKIAAADMRTGMRYAARVNAVMRSGPKDVYEISVANRTSFLASLEHEIPICAGGICAEKKNIAWILQNYTEHDIECLNTWNGWSRITGVQKVFENVECGDLEVDHPHHCYVTNDGFVVGNSKTDTMLAELIALCTGVMPESVPQLRSKFRGPINCRIVVESITTTLHNIIIPKLQWWRWSGVSMPGGDQGHWGWVPKTALIDGIWDTAWQEKTRMLRMICVDPDEPLRALGESTIQFMSHEQDPSDFASGDFHIVLHDEPTKHAIWKENQARTMRVNGRCILAMTWPDDPAIPVDWIFDELYEKGIAGPRKSPDHATIELSTLKNRNLLQDAVRRQSANWSETTRSTRIYGKPIRFSHRIHPLFTDVPQMWSFQAGKVIEPEYNQKNEPFCPETGSLEVVEFCHVVECEPSRTFPTVFLLDPHPRKPHMFMWVQIDPSDDYTVVIDDTLDGTPIEVWRYVENIESSHGMQVYMRLMDPNMAEQPAAGSRSRDTSWVDEFSEAGLRCDLASDSSVGRQRINEYLQPDMHTWRPRIRFAHTAPNSIFQMKRYVWDDHKASLEKDMKQSPKTKNDDFPTLLKYLLNAMPTFRTLLDRPTRIQREGGHKLYGRPR
jgi:hypothetical protein